MPTLPLRLSCLLACVLPLVALAPAAQLRASRPGPPRPVVEEGCKPSGPLRLELVPLEADARGRLGLSFTLEPRRDLLALEWELELSDDLVVADGQARGFGRPGRGARTDGALRLARASLAGEARARVVARGVFEGSDAAGNRFPEPFVVSRAVRWGEARTSAAPVDSREPDGSAVALLAVPTIHAAGHRAGWRPAPGARRAGAEAALGGFTVSGVLEYEDKEWGYGGWTNVDPLLPVRRADVVVLDALTSTVLGTGSTAQDGSFAVVCASAGVTDVVVRFDADTSADAFQRIRVTNGSNVEYTAFSPVFTAHDTTLPLDAGTTTALKLLSGSDEGNPFNMFDMAVSAWEYVTGPQIGASTVTAVRVWWPEAGGSFASGQNAHISTDDGYDDAVILHELGHVVHNLYSDSDSPGGSHFFGDSDQDPRLSFGEGYASFFGGTVMIEELLRQGLYVDSNGAGQSGSFQLRLRLEGVTPYAGDAFGAADEVAVACLLFDVLDDEDSVDNAAGDDDPFLAATLVGGLSPHAAWWQTFVGPVNGAANLTLNDAWNGWFSSHGAAGLHPEMEAVYALREVRFSNDADEPNDDQGSAVPIAVDGQWLSGRTLYSGAGNPPSPGFGDQDWYRMDVVKGSVLEVETRYPDGSSDADTQADTRLQLVSPSGTITTTESGAAGRNAKLSLVSIDETGAWRFRVDSSHVYRRYGRYDLRATYLFENLRPTVLAGPSASPAVIGPFREATQLSVGFDDDQPVFSLVVTWTPLDGGVVTGSGTTVTFTPPPVTQETDFRIEVVAEDTLGAVSEPAVVTVTARPRPRLLKPGQPAGS